MVDTLSLFIWPGKPNELSNVAELTWSLRCGRQLLEGTDGHPRVNLPSENRSQVESTFALGEGEMALRVYDYATAKDKLSIAVAKNPQSARCNLALATALLNEAEPEVTAGIFYLARATRLAPSVTSLKDLLNDYGRLTLNKFHPELAGGRQFIDWLQSTVCSP
jgi:hypothetical protein